MAITAITLSKISWTKITDAGESGTCWKKAGGTIVVSHTDQETAATLPLSNTNVTITKSKKAPLDMNDINPLPIPADNASDIYYALATGEGDSNILVVDVI